MRAEELSKKEQEGIDKEMEECAEDMLEEEKEDNKEINKCLK